jgi:hypothetical protein
MSKAPKYVFSIEPVNSIPEICYVSPRVKDKDHNQYDVLFQLVFGILRESFGFITLLVALRGAILEFDLDNGKLDVEGQFLQADFLLSEPITYSLQQGHEVSNNESIEGKVGSKSGIVPSTAADVKAHSEIQDTDALTLKREFQSNVLNIRANYSPNKPYWFISPSNNQSQLFGRTVFTRFATIDILGLPSTLDYQFVIYPKDVIFLESPVKKDMANSINTLKFVEFLLSRHYAEKISESIKGRISCDRR